MLSISSTQIKNIGAEWLFEEPKEKNYSSMVILVDGAPKTFYWVGDGLREYGIITSLSKENERAETVTEIEGFFETLEDMFGQTKSAIDNVEKLDEQDLVSHTAGILHSIADTIEAIADNKELLSSYIISVKKYAAVYRLAYNATSGFVLALKPAVISLYKGLNNQEFDNSARDFTRSAEATVGFLTPLKDKFVTVKKRVTAFVAYIMA